MNQKNTKYLLSHFPDLYKQYYWDKTQTCMNWGFDVENGWFSLIKKLSRDLCKVSDKIEAIQVKEKFGMLRYYYTASELTDKQVDKIRRLVDKAENDSGKICEICGKKGKIRHDLIWIKTLCTEHYNIFNDPFKYRDYRKQKKK